MKLYSTFFAMYTQNFLSFIFDLLLLNVRISFYINFFYQQNDTTGKNHSSGNTASNKTNSTMKMKEQRDYDNIHIALVGAKNCGKSGGKFYIILIILKSEIVFKFCNSNEFFLILIHIRFLICDEIKIINEWMN